LVLLSFINEAGSKVAAVTGDSRFTTCLKQRVSLAVERFLLFLPMTWLLHSLYESLYSLYWREDCTHYMNDCILKRRLHSLYEWLYIEEKIALIIWITLYRREDCTHYMNHFISQRRCNSLYESLYIAEKIALIIWITLYRREDLTHYMNRFISQRRLHSLYESLHIEEKNALSIWMTVYRREACDSLWYTEWHWRWRLGVTWCHCKHSTV